MASILSDSTNSDEEQEVNEQIKQAYALLQQNRIQQSIILYKKCIQQHPNTWRAYQNLGVAYIMLRQYQNANHVLKTYIQHVPKDPLGHDSLGVSYSQLNDPLQAIACFVNSINLSPTYYMSYYNLGVVLGRLGLYDFALNVYRHCLRLYPNYVNAMNNIADIHKKTNNIDLAIAMFKQIIELDPTYVLGVKNLANCYFSKEMYSDALNTYMKGLQIQPENRDILFNLALCLDHYGLCSEAASAILKGFHHSEDKGNFQVISKPFIAGNLQHKQMTQMYRLLRVCQRLGKRPKKEIVQRYLKAYTAAVGCFEIYDEQEAFFREVKENAYRTKLNFFGCQVKLGEYIINSDENLDFIQHRPVSFYREWLNKRDQMMSQIGKWRRYTKRLIKQQKQRLTPNKSQYQTQKESIYPLFSRPYYPPVQFKTHRYISRVHSHNLKRLILKRHKFISQYNRFTKNLSSAFPRHQLLTTLTVPAQSSVSELQQQPAA